MSNSQDTLNEEYTLSPSDVDPIVDGGDFPSVKAAGASNPAILRAVMRHGWQQSAMYTSDTRSVSGNALKERFGANAFMDGVLQGIYDSPLLRAIQHNRLENVRYLLDAQADPNGQSLDSMSDYSVRFLRFRDPKDRDYSHALCPPREPILGQISLDQNAPLTEEEINDGPARFWTGKSLPPPRFQALNSAMTAVEMAARCGSTECLHAILAKEPDISFWCPSSDPATRSTSTHSALSVSSPLHGAIQGRKFEMIRHLLYLGFDPNIQPVAAPTAGSVAPIMEALICEPPNLEAFDLLTSSPKIELDILTPVYAVHCLHFAAAQLSPALLKHVASKLACGLKTPSVTALGQNILHIASLPATPAEINLGSWKIAESILRVSSLPRSRLVEFLFPPVAGGDPQDQAATIRLIIGASDCKMSHQDVYGNTALHYLAASRTPNLLLIECLQQYREGDHNGNHVWTTTRNKRGHTAKELFEDGQNIGPWIFPGVRSVRGRGRGR